MQFGREIKKNMSKNIFGSIYIEHPLLVINKFWGHGILSANQIGDFYVEMLRKKSFAFYWNFVRLVFGLVKIKTKWSK
jgi:hypothetical protein